ncbi:MAG: S24 family peptidase [Sodaliphilus pleomorphus]|uniref:S24 family peptidase n=1 Tax=Sodaliphilus pleomorphus TaxID=2606626 RepID=UPI002A74B5C1|nr:S24 family peptidase [Sodaliphilus pleomorphus]MDY2833445.1 S24 family peptidase [Sodaliphilus pleomorphus]
MILERIKDFIDTKGISVSAFERSIGMSNASFGKSLKNGGAIGTDKLENILNTYPEINPNWLITGNGSMLKSDEQPLPELKKINSRHKGLPLIPMEAIAGFPAIDNDGVSFDDCQHYSIPEFEAKGANFLIRVSGDSMMPLYCNGDIIACRKIAEIHFFQWGGVYVLDTSQGVLVKYIEECGKNDDCILCVSENKRYKPFPIPKSDIRSLSTIVGLLRLV